MKESEDNNFKLDDNGRKFSEQVENTVGKGEIARHKQSLLFPQCFKRLVLQTHENQGLFGEGLNYLDDLPRCSGQYVILVLRHGL